MLNNGANANIPNNDGNSPLHLAIDLNLKKLQDILIDAGADEFLKNYNGLTPWEGIHLKNGMQTTFTPLPMEWLF